MGTKLWRDFKGLGIWSNIISLRVERVKGAAKEKQVEADMEGGNRILSGSIPISMPGGAADPLMMNEASPQDNSNNKKSSSTRMSHRGAMVALSYMVCAGQPNLFLGPQILNGHFCWRTESIMFDRIPKS